MFDKRLLRQVFVPKFPLLGEIVSKRSFNQKRSLIMNRVAIKHPFFLCKLNCSDFASMRKNTLENLTVKAKQKFGRKAERRRMDYLIDSSGNLVCLDNISRYVVHTLGLIVLIDKSSGFIGGNLTFDVSFRRVKKIL